MSIRSYIAEMPAGAVLLERLDAEQPTILYLSDWDVPSGLHEAVREELASLSDANTSLTSLLVQPVVMEIIKWECRTRGEDAATLYELIEVGEVPHWGASDPRRAASLIARAYDLCDPEIVGVAESVCSASGAQVPEVLALVLANYWEHSGDIEEFVLACASAIAPVTTT